LWRCGAAGTNHDFGLDGDVAASGDHRGCSYLDDCNVDVGAINIDNHGGDDDYLFYGDHFVIHDDHDHACRPDAPAEPGRHPGCRPGGPRWNRIRRKR
jgi:hypothetical protein